jgi:phenylpyruvate tautomerase PptA (4-oxalocrotonate tautomerase family)
MTLVIVYVSMYLIIISKEPIMPMIDVYAPADLFPAGADAELGAELTHAVLRAEGHYEEVIPAIFTQNTAAFVHRLPLVTTAASPEARAVRIQVITPPGSLNRDGQRQLTKEATEIVAKIAGDETLATRTWVIITEAAEGGWGIAGTAFGKEEFGALAARSAAARA